MIRLRAGQPPQFGDKIGATENHRRIPIHITGGQRTWRMLRGESVCCAACGCTHPIDPGQSTPFIRAESFVVIGRNPRKPLTRFFRLVQEQAEQPISFGQLCEAVRRLPREVTTPWTAKDQHMVLCTRLQYAVKHGILDPRPQSASDEKEGTTTNEKAKAQSSWDKLSQTTQMEIAVPPITRPAAQVCQGSLRLYTTSLKVRDLKLPGFYRINKLDPDEDGPGFQRLLNQGRAKRLAEYLLDGQAEGDAFLPTSIFLATNEVIPFDSERNSITFDIKDVGPFNVVDGQHRIAGLVAAADKNPELLDFELPVNIAVGLDDVSQMCHFLIVNTTQRSVDKAVEQQIVARLSGMIDVEDMPTIPRWIRRQVEKGEDARALVIAKHLNTDPSSPWFNKIRMANDENPDSTINQKSFVNSVKKYLFSASNPLADSSFDASRPKILSNYWKAIVELLVDPDSAKSTVIFKTTGVDLFHIVSATVFLYLVNKKDFKKDTIKEVLERGFGNLIGDNMAMASPEWWERGNVASGLNSAAVRKLAMALSQAINVQDGVGDIDL